MLTLKNARSHASFASNSDKRSSMETVRIFSYDSEAVRIFYYNMQPDN
jgi:hypothetical protein